MIIFRIETEDGVYDSPSLTGAKTITKPNEYIQAVAPDGLTVLGRALKEDATPLWAAMIGEKYGYDYKISPQRPLGFYRPEDTPNK